MSAGTIDDEVDKLISHPSTYSPTIMSESHLQVTYMPVRGRCEPIFLMLADSGVKFAKDIIDLDEWTKMKRAGMVGPSRFPYSGLPVLRVPKSKGQDGFVLGETTAILAFLDEYLQQGGRETVCRTF
jgi:hypothetical protein